MSDPLSPSALTALLPRLVSPSTSLSSPPQALALVVHAIHSALSFRLISPSPSSTPAPTSTDGGQAEAPHPNKLPDGWPVAQGGELKLKYRHEQSSLEFVVSVVELGGRALIAGVAVDNPRSTSFDLLLTDYLSPSSLSSSSPFTIPSSLSSFCPPFSAPHRLADFVLLYRLNVLQKLVPGLRKDGYTEVSERDVGSSSSSSSSGGRGGAGGGGGPTGGRGGYLPDLGGPLGMFPPPRPSNPDSNNDPLRIPGSGGRGGGGLGGTLVEIGRSDLDPLGGMGGTFGGGLPGRSPFGGGGGMGGGSPFGGGGFGGDGGGMFMGPDHPLFRERFGPGGVGGGVGGGGRRWGGDGYLPEGGAPQGARFDPVGPVNGPPGGSGLGVGPGQAGFHPGPGGGVGGVGGGTGGPLGGGQRGVHPDLERPGGDSEWQNSMFG
ncbi:hypothetical protein JCM8547_003684 [Rhodosporidiobolus lusitaniae]